MAVADYAAGPVDPTSCTCPRPSELEAILTAPMPGRPGTTLADALPDDDGTDPGSRQQP